MSQILVIFELIAKIGGQLFTLAEQAIEAHKTGDQTKLDAIHASAVAAADALKPAGV